MEWKFAVGIVGAIATWLGSVYMWWQNQRSQRAQNEYQRKEQLYGAMLKSMSVFYKGSGQGGDVRLFLEQYRLAWLYAPDDVIQALRSFLDTLKPEVPPQEKDRLGGEALARLVCSIRKDLFSISSLSTKLSAKDFAHYS